ncbi:hypothetical protein F2P81_004407 [Scophthalmus maximus]|uniref:Uncharacterized protein n=1 Tax=Scophthalmus maximus TaxID=52904 RepID=A0A6A4TH27_SCOMX|nr:hypothetical protein F2P81_004407 [Scophthalmus maximus]
MLSPRLLPFSDGYMKTVLHGGRFRPLQHTVIPGVLHIYALRTAIVLRSDHCRCWLLENERQRRQCSGGGGSSASGGVAAHYTAHTRYGG